MPVHLNSIMNGSLTEAFAHILLTELQAVDDAWGEESKTHFLASSGLFDAETGRQVGQYVFTIFNNLAKKQNEVLDIDIVLDNPTPVELEFLRKYPASSDSNEYYEAQTTDTQQHLDIETVNRYLLPMDITGSKQIWYTAPRFPMSYRYLRISALLTGSAA